jgi:glycosyltransferase involved in cell wall biosynthesis
MEQSKVGPKGERVGTIESKSTELEAGPCLAGQAGASESDSLASELAESPNFKSLTRCASGLASSPATRQSSLATEPEVPSPAASRSSLATPDSQDIVFLAFGQIRDGKNLDLFLQVMPNLPDNVKLLVAGMGDSGSSKSPNYYQRLAEELGVANRCRWDVRRIPEGELGDFFEACDVVLLTYSAKFRSASGVLNTAVSARKPVLASSGPGPLKNAVNKYHLGVFVEPDNPEEVLRGAKQLLDSLSPPATHKLAARRSTLDACFPPANIDSPHDTAGVFLTAWDLYEKENSWEKNALGVTVAF